MKIHARYLFRVLIHHVRFEVLSAVLLRIQVFSDVTLFHWAHTTYFQTFWKITLFEFSVSCRQRWRCMVLQQIKNYTPVSTVPYPRISESWINSSTLYRVIWSLWKLDLVLSNYLKEDMILVCPMHVSCYAIAQEIKLLASCSRGLGLNAGYSMWVVWRAEW